MNILAPLAILMLSALPLHAEGLKVGDAFIPDAPPSVPMRAAYVSLTNEGDTPRILIEVRAESFAMAHLHESRMEGGVMTMSPLAQIEIAPGATLSMQPGGLHVMLMKPSVPLKLGDQVMLSLSFADGETIEIPVPVTDAQGGHGGHGS